MFMDKRAKWWKVRHSLSQDMCWHCAGDWAGLGADRAPAHRPAGARPQRAPGALEVAEVRFVKC